MGIPKDMKDIPLLGNISGEVREAFLSLLSAENAKAGEIIFEEGSTSDRFFIIKDGEVEIRKAVDVQKARYKLIAVLSSGEFFGEMAVFMGEPRSAEAIARTDATLLTVSRNDLSGLFAKSPDTAFKVMEFLTSVLMERLRNTTKELAIVYETGRQVAAARSVPELSERVMDGLFGALDNAEAGLLIVWNDFNAEYEVCGRRGFGLEPGASISKDDGLMKWLFENRESFLSFNLANDGRLAGAAGGIYEGARSMVVSPLLSRDGLIGVLIAFSRTRTNAFSFNHMVLLSAVSGYATVALENLKYIQQEIDRNLLTQTKSSIL